MNEWLATVSMHGHVAQAGGADQFTEAALLAAEADPLPDLNTEGTRKEKMNTTYLRVTLQIPI